MTSKFLKTFQHFALRRNNLTYNNLVKNKLILFLFLSTKRYHFISNIILTIF